MGSSTDNGTAKPGTTALTKVLLLATGVVVGLVLCEGVVRLVAPQRLTPLAAWDSTGLHVRDSTLGWALQPGFRGRWVRGIPVSVDSLGLRDREYSAKQPHEIRILSLGDSYDFGFGVELSASYPKVLESLLAARFPACRISVINAGVSGYTTYQEILQFGKLSRLLHPDFVLATFVGSNDVYDNAIIRGQLQQKVETPVGPLAQHSHFARLALRIAFPVTYRLASWWGPNIALTIRRLQELERRIRAAKLPYLMLVIPARHQIRPGVNAASKWLDKLGLYELSIRQNTAIIHHFQHDSVPYIDLLPALRERDKTERVSFSDDSHTNDVGHQVMARQIYQGIEPVIAAIATSNGCSANP